MQVLQDTVISVPQIPSHGRSIVKIGSGLELLSPQVSPKLSFRLTLYLAQMIRPQGDRRTEFERMRAEYNTRSRIVHGSRRRVSGPTER